MTLLQDQVQIALENKDIIWGMYPQLSAETPSNGLMLPKKGKPVGYKLNLTSLNTKPNKLKKKNTQKKKKQTHEEM